MELIKSRVYRENPQSLSALKRRRQEITADYFLLKLRKITFQFLQKYVYICKIFFQLYFRILCQLVFSYQEKITIISFRFGSQIEGSAEKDLLLLPFLMNVTSFLDSFSDFCMKRSLSPLFYFFFSLKKIKPGFAKIYTLKKNIFLFVLQHF